jgi:iron complex outermembrane receptor protein
VNHRRKTILVASASLLAAGFAHSAAAAAAPAAADVGEIVVTGIRASQEASIQTKRNADAVVDAITAEDVGKFPDKNVAESLSRVPGVVINREFGEGERVSVRGTAPNLTRTVLDGHGLATADWFILDQLSATRSFNYLMLPSEIIGRVQVYKSPTADLEEGGVGALIDVETRRPLDLKPLFVAGSLQAAINEMSGKTNPAGSLLLSWKNSAETFGVLVAGIYEDREIRRDGVETLGYFNNGTAANPQQVPSLIGSALFQQERIRKGVNAAVQWRPNGQLEVDLTGLISKFGANNFNENFLAWPVNALGGGGTLTNVTMQGDTAIAGRVASTPGGRGAVYDSIERFADTETRNIDLEVKYHLSDDWDLRARIGYTDAFGNTDSQPFVEFGAPATFDYDLRGGTPQVHFLNLDPTQPSQMVFDFASLHKITSSDDERYAYLDVKHRVEWGPLKAIKFGGKFTDHNRGVDFQATTYGGFFLPLAANGCGGQACLPANFAGGLTPSDFLQNIAQPGTLRSYFQVATSKLENILFNLPANVRQRVPNYPAIFSVREKAFAGYVMGDFSGENWRGNIGLRVVRTEQTSGGYVQQSVMQPGFVSNAFGIFQPVSIDRTYTDVLPSANFSYDLRPDLLFRFAAARTMARPDYTDVAPTTNLNVGSLTGTSGNPNVDPYRADQFDVSLEWYPNKDTVVAAGLFYKAIESFVTDKIVQQRFAVETGTPNLARCTSAATPTSPNLYNCLFDISQRSNGGGGHVEGVELTVQAPIWNGFGVQTNYTYSHAKTESGDPLPGNSENTFNITGYYENDRLSARLAYTYRSNFFITVDRASPLNQKSLSELDAQLSFNVTPQVALTFDAINLTDEKIEQYAGDTFRPRAIYDNGRQYYAGVRFKF